MIKARLLFKKEGRAKYISHLDLMHTMQRAFVRAGIPIRHTEGFNPHPYMSILLPLSVGCESRCEMLDFDLEDDALLDRVPELLTRALPEGLTAVKAYPRLTKGAMLKWLEITGTLTYDHGGADKLIVQLSNLFASREIVVTKRTKRGEAELDLVPNIRRIAFSSHSDRTVELTAVISAQDPSINPDSLVAAIAKYLPDCKPDFAEFTRIEVYNSDLGVFR